MQLSGATDSLTVGNLLPGSILQTYNVGAEAAPAIQGAGYFVWAVLFIIFFALIFKGQTGIFIAWAGDFIRFPAKRTYFTTSSAVSVGLPLTVLMFLPLAACLVYGPSAVVAPYWLILAVMAGYAVLKAVVLAGIGYVSGEKEAMTALARANALFFIILTLMLSILTVIWVFLPDVPPVVVGAVAETLTALLLLIYGVMLVRIFFAFREPLLLTILYLCTLEIMPIATAVVTVFKY